MKKIVDSLFRDCLAEKDYGCVNTVFCLFIELELLYC